MVDAPPALTPEAFRKGDFARFPLQTWQGGGHFSNSEPFCTFGGLLCCKVSGEEQARRSMRGTAEPDYGCSLGAMVLP
jgi:hypothetical protein